MLCNNTTRFKTTEIEDNLDRIYRLDGVAHIVGSIHEEPHRCNTSMRRSHSLPQGAEEETVRRYARAYIIMLLSTQFFGDKSGTRMNIRWLSYVVRLENMDRYIWGSATLL
ncbi:hypothetical protein Ahy_A01g000511 [Arachis hypogaea]|uniref:Aminotransferase-like plant mobile domain-containing protein n=1 Tax=Arachis hypogaea TaxID=3818 RepID=A0A445EKK4_ARAHY|nr:hypothetical protein Ahy_A01g000511 [Arachis hypogaea]